MYVAALKGLDGREAKRKADELLAEVGLKKECRQKIRTFSGGMKQRLGIAQAMLNDPRILILDEPTTGLHFHDIKKLLRSFEALMQKGHTVVVVEHNMDVVKCADWVIDLGPEGGEAGGELVFAGTPRELAEAPAAVGSHTAHYLKEVIG